MKVEVEVEVVSRETIKPSSPTPHHLRTVPFSFLDQIATPVFMPFLLFYPKKAVGSHVQNDENSNNLKKSLSETLTHFYPLAGRVQDNTCILCNDNGVPFMEAIAKCKLSEAIGRMQMDPAELNKLLPFDLHDVGDLVLAIQVNVFDCGGVAIGVCISHKVADAFSRIMFINHWAATARGGDHHDPYLVPPRFESAGLFPAKNIYGYYVPSTGIIKDKIVTKRFVFNFSMITKLREKYTEKNTSTTKRPTRIEALSAFIWTRFVTSTQTKLDPHKLYTLIHAVNLRTRMSPSLSNSHFGNIIRFAVAQPSAADNGSTIVSLMRDSIDKIDGDYVKDLRQGDGHLNFIKDFSRQYSSGEMVPLSFTSLCRFPVYEADFGWGKPVWVSTARLTFKNLVVFMDSGSEDDGIEVWVNMKEEDMTKFEGDEEFLEFVSAVKSGG